MKVSSGELTLQCLLVGVYVGFVGNGIISLG